RVASVRTAERHLHHEGRHDLRRRFRIRSRHRRARAAWNQEGDSDRQRENRPGHGVHRRHGIHDAGSFRRGRRRSGRGWQRVRRGRPAADARAACQEINTGLAARYSLLAGRRRRAGLSGPPGTRRYNHDDQRRDRRATVETLRTGRPLTQGKLVWSVAQGFATLVLVAASAVWFSGSKIRVVRGVGTLTLSIIVLPSAYASWK